MNQRNSIPPGWNGQCLASNRQGARCAKRGILGVGYCEVHRPDKETCEGTTVFGEPCRMNAGPTGFCEHHEDVRGRQNGRPAPSSEPAGPWPDGVHIREVEIVRKLITVAIDLEDGHVLKASMSRNSMDELETVHLGRAGPDGKVPAEHQVGPIPGPIFEKFLDVMDRVLDRRDVEKEPAVEPEALEL